MPIVSSIFVVHSPQANDTSYVRETHTWHNGIQTVVEYGPVPDTTPYQTVADARADQLEVDLMRTEFMAILNGAPLVFAYQTGAEFAARFWERLRNKHEQGRFHEQDQIEFSRMVHWLYGRVQAGELASADVRVSFNNAYGRSLNNAQWNSFVSGTLAPIRDRYQAMLDQVDL